MKYLVCCALLVLGAACESKASSRVASSIYGCGGYGEFCPGDAGPGADAPEPDAGSGDAGPGPDAPEPDAGSGSGSDTEPGDFPDPNGEPPPPETTCDCNDADADQICDNLDSCIGTCDGPPDAGMPDAGMPDAGIFDAGIFDAGIFDAGIWSAQPRARNVSRLAGAAIRGAHGLRAGNVSTLADATISGWGCEYSRPTCTATTGPTCTAIQDCEWVGGTCRPKACVESWRQLCLSYIQRRAGNDRYAYRGNSTWMSNLFTTGPAPVPVEWRWGDVGGSVNYTWEGHSGVTWVNNFLTFVTEVVRDRVPTATTFNLTNNGCGTFNVTNFQTIRTYLRNTLHPILRAATPRQTAVVCGQQNVCSTNDSTAYRACGDGQCAGARGNDFSRICFSVDGNVNPPVISYNVFNQCRIGSTCSNWPGNNLSWCRSATTGDWACQRCTQVGTTTTWRFESQPIAACNTAAGVN